MKTIYFIGMLAGGFALVKYAKWVTDNTMRIPTAENYLGGGGTVTFWKIFGVGAMLFSFYYLFNM